MTTIASLVRVWLALTGLAQPVSPAGLTVRPDVEYITRAFDSYPLVAFSEPGHGVSGTAEFFARLIRHPGFAGTVTDIVIECGNARYQDIADHYFAGEAIDRRTLARIWRDTTVVSGVWDAPLYEAILADIRAFNLTLPPARRIRVLLGDPPVDWTAVRGPADEDMNDWRDAHFAWVTEQQVMKRRRKALLWIGGAHTARRVILPDSLIHLLDRRFANQTLVVHSVDSQGVSPAVSARLTPWPARSAVPVRGTWLGRLDVAELDRRLSRGVLEDDVDALVFWERGTAVAGPAPLDGEDAMELRRRQQLAVATVPFRGGQVRFDAGAAAFAAGSEAALEIVLAELRRDGGLKLLVKGFTDAREPDPARLSLARASRVVAWLSARGISQDRLEARGCEASRALWPGDTGKERDANRRAELVRASALAGCMPPSSF